MFGDICPTELRSVVTWWSCVHLAEPRSSPCASFFLLLVPHSSPCASFFSLCSTDMTAREFTELRGKQRSRYHLLVEFLSEMLSVPTDSVNVFSLTDVKERMLDVRFAVHVGVSFLLPEKMHGYLAAHKQKVGRLLLGSVSQTERCGATDTLDHPL